MNESPIRDVMPWPPRLAIEVEARPALELLIGLGGDLGRRDARRDVVLAPERLERGAG
jgi:hypothetical protein